MKTKIISGPSVKNMIIVLLLCGLVVSGFLIRLNNFSHSNRFSIDEILYYVLGWQLAHYPFEYNAKRAQDLILEIREDMDSLPDYFNQPLFKHPPVFGYLSALSFKIFSRDDMYPAFYVSCLMGVLMIPLIFLLGKLLVDEGFGLAAAFLVWLDPIYTICSQKVWIDTTLAFFSIGSLYLYLIGIHKKKSVYFYLMGVFIALAALTKYPGILMLFVVLIHALLFSQEVIRNKHFWVSTLLTLLLLVPWFLWNIFVYGSNFGAQQILMHNELASRGPLVLGLLSLFLLLIILFVKKVCVAKSCDEDLLEDGCQDRLDVATALRVVVLVLFGIALAGPIRNSLILTSMPWNSWGHEVVKSPRFYFGQLFEFFPFYIFAFLGLFLQNERQREKFTSVILSLAVLLLFYLFWRNYQSRYILTAIPLLILMGLAFVRDIWRALSFHQNLYLRLAGRLVIALFLLYAFVKVCYVNTLITFPNDLCYF